MHFLATVILTSAMILSGLGDIAANAEKPSLTEVITSVKETHLADIVEAIPIPTITSLGTHKVTGYVWTGNPCASGVYPYAGCCAVNGLPFGSIIYISELGYYTVEDRGGMSDPYHVDIYCSSVSECRALTGYYEIFVIE